MIDSLEKFLSSDFQGFYYIGHASALLRIDEHLILCDPVFGDYKPYNPWWILYPKQIDCTEILDRIDACIVSHIHADHWAPEILAKLKCPVHIMCGRVELRETLLKHANVIEHNAWDWVRLTDNVDVFYVPHSFNSVDSSCFLANKDRSYTAYVGSDNFLSKEILNKIKSKITRVDVAAIPTQFIHYYPYLLDSLTEEEKKSETKRLVDQSYEQAMDFVREMKPGMWFPFGGDLYYNGGRDHILNRHLQDNSSVKSGCYILTYGQISGVHYNGVREDFPENQLPELDTKVGFESSKLWELQSRIQSTPDRVANHMLFVNGVAINLETLEVSYYGTFRGEKPYTAFEFDKEVFYKWFSGEITFEESIGTRRFVYFREPNLYDFNVVNFYSRWL